MTTAKGFIAQDGKMPKSKSKQREQNKTRTNEQTNEQTKQREKRTFTNKQFMAHVHWWSLRVKRQQYCNALSHFLLSLPPWAARHR
jgi:hypothetical protein